MHARRVPSHVFLVLSSLFLRHDSQILLTIPRLGNTLAVATVVITIAGQTHSTVFGSPQGAPVPLDSSCQLIPAAIFMHLERPGTWLHGSVDRDVGFPDMPQLPPEQGVLLEGASSQVGRSVPQNRMHIRRGNLTEVLPCSFSSSLIVS